jgi:hypothetical protein
MAKIASRQTIDIPQFSSETKIFCIGDTVRSYRSPFDSDKPFKNAFIQGVVVAIESWIRPNDYLVVKWAISNHFGAIHRFKMPHNGSDTFAIGVSSPFLVKINNGQLALAI